MPQSLCANPACGQPFVNQGKRMPQRFCSTRCRYAVWVAAHPRARHATTDRQSMAQVGQPPIIAPEGANAVLARLAALEARLPAVLAVRTPSDPASWKHGANCYRNHGCRCQVCIDGARARWKRRH